VRRIQNRCLQPAPISPAWHGRCSVTPTQQEEAVAAKPPFSQVVRFPRASVSHAAAEPATNAFTQQQQVVSHRESAHDAERRRVGGRAGVMKVAVMAGRRQAPSPALRSTCTCARTQESFRRGRYPRGGRRQAPALRYVRQQEGYVTQRHARENSGQFCSNRRQVPRTETMPQRPQNAAVIPAFAVRSPPRRRCYTGSHAVVVVSNARTVYAESQIGDCPTIPCRPAARWRTERKRLPRVVARRRSAQGAVRRPPPSPPTQQQTVVR